MKCPDCEGKVDIHHTFTVGPTKRTSGGICRGCNKRWVFVTMIEAQEYNGHGTGAWAKAQALKAALATTGDPK